VSAHHGDDVAARVRLAVPAASLGDARRIAAILEEACWPPPLAVTLFAVPSAAPETAPAGSTLDPLTTTWAGDLATPRGPHVVHAFFENEETATEARAMLTELNGDGDGEFLVETVPALDWVRISQQALPPVEAGRFIVHGSHDRARVGRRHWAIEIDAGEAFGTAHHATTLGCLHAIDRLAHTLRVDRILDLGCGTGVLAIAAAKVWPAARLLASDIDPEAVRVAHANIGLAGLAHRIAVSAGNGLAGKAIRRGGPFDLVFANILAGPLVRLAPAMARAAAPGGLAVLSGLLVGQEAEVRAAYAAAGFTVVRIERLLGWSILTLRRRR
jgi:ribosomal protein L11 methyltransferase